MEEDMEEDEEEDERCPPDDEIYFIKETFSSATSPIFLGPFWSYKQLLPWMNDEISRHCPSKWGWYWGKYPHWIHNCSRVTFKMTDRGAAEDANGTMRKNGIRTMWFQLFKLHNSAVRIALERGRYKPWLLVLTEHELSRYMLAQGNLDMLAGRLDAKIIGIHKTPEGAISEAREKARTIADLEREWPQLSVRVEDRLHNEGQIAVFTAVKVLLIQIWEQTERP